MSLSLIVIYTPVLGGRRVSIGDAHNDRSSSLIFGAERSTLLEPICDLLSALIFYPRPERIDHLLDLARGDPSYAVGAQDLVKMMAAPWVGIVADELSHMVRTDRSCARARAPRAGPAAQVPALL